MYDGLLATSIGNPLAGNGTGKGGIATIATILKLYTGATTPGKTDEDAKPAGAFIEVTTGNGYASVAITSASWTLSLDVGDQVITLANVVWTATGGPISDVNGAFITDLNDNVMGWWERASAVTLQDTESITAQNLRVKLPGV